MGTELAKVLDECIERIRKGETIEACLAEYPDMREQIEPLLQTALSISTIPEVSPSDEFRRISKARLLIRLRQEFRQAEAVKSGQRMPLLDGLAIAWQRLYQNITVARKVAIPVTIALLLVLGTCLYLYVSPNFLSPSPALAAQCTLSTLCGSVEVQQPGSDSWQQGADGMTLVAGTRIKTALDAHALLTFFEGSTIKLEPNTDVQIQQVEGIEAESTTIVLKQRLGRTWSNVVKRVDSAHYAIDTPSASAIVQGTLFVTEVDETGLTKVTTTDGLVSVVAQDEEVQLPANQQTQVEAGAAPSQPVMALDATSELLITIDMPAVGSVCDPTGSSTGYLPSGFSFNQILGSQSSSPSENTQIITIAQPMTGEYVITLRYISQGVAKFSIQGESESEAAFVYGGALEAVEEGGWLIYLNLNVDDGVIVSSEISGVEPLGDETPGKVVEAELTGEGAISTGPAAQDGDTTDDSTGGKGKGDTGDKDKGGAGGKGKGDTGDKDKGDAGGKGKGDTGDKDKGDAGGKGKGGASGKGKGGTGGKDK